MSSKFELDIINKTKYNITCESLIQLLFENYKRLGFNTYDKLLLQCLKTIGEENKGLIMYRGFSSFHGKMKSVILIPIEGSVKLDINNDILTILYRYNS
ncbi:alpha gene product [Kotonkan virus]|uniref:Alpha 2 protein n=1 Tax=Kotonkan virus TaxID=318836 RepID=H8XWF6_9RHAB|nr:alpha gene product [Kotonkan virus]AEI17636.1 alpha 2 protein [Kotonkan virus]